MALPDSRATPNVCTFAKKNAKAPARSKLLTETSMRAIALQLGTAYCHAGAAQDHEELCKQHKTQSQAAAPEKRTPKQTS